MNNGNRVLVLKFGSSVLRSERDLPQVVQEVSRNWRNGYQVIVIVSAFGDRTNELLGRAESICSNPLPSAVATLLATGEAESSALLGLSLQAAGVPVCVLDATAAGLWTSGATLDANPVAIDSERLLEESGKAVVVLPGFVGRGDRNHTTLLGRGGSDLSALFIAERLQGHCRLLKDVDGLYTSDPADSSVRALRFSRASYETAIRVGGSVVQQKAVRFAAAHKQVFSISSIGAVICTEIGPFSDQLAASTPTLSTSSPIAVTSFQPNVLVEVGIA
jgi:homoserine dehydrogenase